METIFSNHGCLGVETKKIDGYLKKFGLISEGWFLDDTIHLCNWYGKGDRWYHVAIFGSPFSERYYISIKCGFNITRLNINGFTPINQYPSLGDFIGNIENNEVPDLTKNKN